jgi:uncharacterized protein YutE (UPF0331/DUF86 family)
VVEAGTVRTLLGTIETRLIRLEEMASVPLATFQSSQDLQDIAERNFEVLIQACIDLGLHLLADQVQTLPETNRAVFTALADCGIIDAALGGELARMAGFRNLLAHGYTRLVPAMVYAHLTRLEDVRAYVAQVHLYLKQSRGFG